MRLLLSWKKYRGDVLTLVDRLQGAGHEVVYLIGNCEIETAFKKQANAIFHNKDLAFKGVPAEGVVGGAPVATELVHAMAHIESTVFTLMNKGYGAETSFEERRHRYYEQLGYWDEVLRTERVEALVFDEVPHAAHTYILSELAKYRGLRVVVVQRIRMFDRFMVYGDWRHEGRTLTKALRNNAGRAYTPADLSADIQASYERQTNPKEDATPFFMTRDFIARRAKRGKNPLLYGAHALLQSAKALLSTTRAERLKQEYREVATSPDLAKPYVYLALHSQPERSTTPVGGIFTDQVLTAEVIASVLPAGWQLYVKEHPLQHANDKNLELMRYEGYYRRLANLPHTTVVPLSTNTFALETRAKAVATVSGSVGFEALCRSTPALVFGAAWYASAPGAFRIRGLEECRAALAQIAAGPVFDGPALIAYLKSFDEASIAAYRLRAEDWLAVVDQGTPMEPSSMEQLAEGVLGELVAAKSQAG